MALALTRGLGMRWTKLAMLAGAAVTLAAPGVTFADPAIDLARKFGARESVQQVSLSPDGTKLAVIVPAPSGGQALAVVDLAGDASLRPILKARGGGEELSYCRWATDAMLICSILYRRDGADRPEYFSRLLTVDSASGGTKMLSQDTSNRGLYQMNNGGSLIDWVAEGRPGRILMTRQFVPQTSINTGIKSELEGLGVEAVDVETQKRAIIEKPRGDSGEFIADGQGTVRVMGMYPREPTGYLKGYVDYLYRRKGSRDWEKLGKLELGAQSQSGFNPHAVDSTVDVVYGFDDAGGFTALYSVALDGTFAKTLLVSRNDVDVDGLIRIGRSRRVVGASYATEKRRSEFFDPDLKRLRASLAKALPQFPLIDFVDSTADESKLLVFAGSDTHPGTFYLFDKATKSLGPLLPLRAELNGVALGAMKPVTYPGPDGVQIPGYLTLPAGSSGKGLPAIVMPHGGPGARDEWGFDWLAQYYAARGFAVLQPNFRGSAGYGSAWFQKNGFQSWKVAIGDVNAAGRWLEAQGIAAPGKLAIVGWSYGGYAALQSPALDPGLFQAIVAVAPVTDLDRWRSDFRDTASFKLVDEFVGRGPHLREGSPAQNAGLIKAPVLLFHGDKDTNVEIGHSKLMADRLRDAGKQVEFVEFKELDHYLDDSEARSTMLAQSDAFIRRALGL